MASYDRDLLGAADLLLGRHDGRRGKLPTALARRSISTAYYALFHFILEEAGKELIGTHSDLLRRRRTFARLFSHSGIKKALDPDNLFNPGRFVGRI